MLTRCFYPYAKPDGWIYSREYFTGREYCRATKKEPPGYGRLISLLMGYECVSTCNADLTNLFALVLDNLIGATAKVARGLEFLENYPITVYKKFNGVVVGNSKVSAV